MKRTFVLAARNKCTPIVLLRRHQNACRLASTQFVTAPVVSSSLRFNSTSQPGLGGDDNKDQNTPKPHPSIRIRVGQNTDASSSSGDAAASGGINSNSTFTASTSTSSSTTEEVSAAEKRRQEYEAQHAAKKEEVISRRMSAIGDHLYGADFQQTVDQYLAKRDAGGDRDARLEYMLRNRELGAFQGIAIPMIYRIWVLMGVFCGGYVFYNVSAATESDEESEGKKNNNSLGSKSATTKYSSTEAQDALMRYLGTLSLASGAAISAVYLPFVSLLLALDYSYVMWTRYGQKWLNGTSGVVGGVSVVNAHPIHLSGVTIPAAGTTNKAVAEAIAATAGDSNTSADDDGKKRDGDSSAPQTSTGFRPTTTVTTTVDKDYEHGVNLNVHEEVITKALPIWFAAALTANFTLVFVRMHMAKKGKRPPGQL